MSVRSRLLAACLGCWATMALAQDDTRPNIVYVFADDMGWGTGQYNNPDSPVETPHLNALASGGLNFTRHYSATVCSPSRAMLMTGFHTGNTSNDRNGNIGQGLQPEEVTVAEVLSDAGYQTSVFGKWGWGGSGGSGVLRPSPNIANAQTLPHDRGFDEFYGYLNHGRAHSYQVDSLWTNIEPGDDGDGIPEVGEKYEPNPSNGLWLERTGNTSTDTLANYTHDLIGLKSEAYIRDRAGADEPFYMQVNYTIPHFDLDAIAGTDPLRNLRGDAVFPGGLAQYAAHPSMTDKEKKHAAMISRMDASIGSLIQRLEDPNGDGDSSDSVLDNTLILFSSDNGPTPEDQLSAGSLTNLDLAGGLRGGKRDLYEGGIRTPLLVRWDAKIDEARRGTADATPTDLADFMATAADLAGGSTPVGIDGVSIAPVITQAGSRRSGKVIVSENFESSQTGNPSADWTVIRGNQKLIKLRSGAFGLYDLASDPGESSPLDLGVPGNQALKQELEQIALAEGAGRNDSYSVRYAEWTGGVAGGAFLDAGNWSVAGVPSTNWSATINNPTPDAKTVAVRGSAALLGLEVRGGQAETLVDVAPGQTLSARNEVRIGDGGRIEIAAAELKTSRWVDVATGGTLGGEGVVGGTVYNRGVMAPGRAEGLPEIDNTPEPIGQLVPRDLDSGQTALVDFDFAGVQDDAPLTQTTALQPNTRVAEGFNFGPATGPRNAADAGDEFNVSGFSTGTSLASALAGDHYLTFSIEPDEGAGLIVEEVRFDLWRNGANAADNYAIFTSVDGFSEAAALAQFAYPESLSGVASTQSITASPLFGGPVTDPVEVRVYGWGSNGSAGNTHFNHVSATGRVVAVPTWELDFNGIQDTPGLATPTSGSTEAVHVVGGLVLASGLEFSDTNDAGDEFNVAGWATGGSRTDAQAADDYVAFTVQAIDGLAMAIESVAFDLWRDGASAPSQFAVMSSLGGFALDALAAGDATVLGVGPTNGAEVVGAFDTSSATQDPIEMRLYGWDTASDAGNVHLRGVELRALFQTVFDVDLSPVGSLVIDGDLHHQAGGLIDIEIESATAAGDGGSPNDRVVVLGEAKIEGDLRLTPIAGHQPVRGESYELLTATSVEGVFDQLVADPIGGTLGFRLVYESDRVLAIVAPLLEGDYNVDGVVDASDYTVWRDSLDRQVTPFSEADGDGNGVVDVRDYDLWAAHYGATIPSNLRSVPEPSTSMALLATVTGVSTTVRKNANTRRTVRVTAETSR